MTRIVGMVAVALGALLLYAKQPEPGPGPAPVPPVPVVVDGPLSVVILHETADQMPADSALYVQLRGGEFDSYLRGKGHKLVILDDDTQTPLVQSLAGQGVPLPAMFILDQRTGKVVAKMPRPATPAAVMEALKANGG